MIFVASDHGGFNLKNEIIKYLQSKQLDVTDMGPSEYIADDDYTDYVYPLSHRVAVSPFDNKGILICRNGVGVCMFANKVKGIRAALSWTPEHAASSRNDDNSNILALPADYINVEMAKKIVNSWISTPFSNELRHKRRLEKIEQFEKQL